MCEQLTIQAGGVGKASVRDAGRDRRWVRLVAGMFGLMISGNAWGQLSIVPTNAAFTDIRATGTPITPLSDDSEALLPFEVLAAAGWGGNRVFAGGVGVLVGNNGGIIWNPVVGQADQIGFVNTPLPSAPSNSTSGGNGNGLRQFVAVMWDDLLPSSSAPATELDWQVIDGDLLVQWSLEDNFDAIGPGRITFQARFFSAAHVSKTGVVASLLYLDTLYAPGQDAFNDGASATIGYNGNGVGEAPGATLYSFNTAAVSGMMEGGNPNLPSGLNLVIPSPGAGAVMGLGVWLIGRRRR